VPASTVVTSQKPFGFPATVLTSRFAVYVVAVPVTP